MLRLLISLGYEMFAGRQADVHPLTIYLRRLLAIARLPAIGDGDAGSQNRC